MAHIFMNNWTEIYRFLCSKTLFLRISFWYLDSSLRLEKIYMLNIAIGNGMIGTIKIS